MSNFPLMPSPFSLYYANEIWERFFNTRPPLRLNTGIEIADDTIQEIAWNSAISVEDNTASSEEAYAKEAKIKVFISNDGAKLLRLFKDKDLIVGSNDLLVFIEMDEDFISSKVLRIRIGRKAKKALRLEEELDALSLTMPGVTLSVDDIKKLIASAKVSKESFLKRLMGKAIGKVVEYNSWITEGLITQLSALIEKLNGIKVQKSSWATEGIKEKLIFHDEVETILEYVDSIDDLLNDAAQLGGFANKTFGDYLLGLKKPLEGYRILVQQILNDTQEMVEFGIGMLYGIYNGIIDLISGMLQLLVLFYKGYNEGLKLNKKLLNNLGYYTQLFVEYYESFITAFLNINWLEVMKTIGEGYLMILKAISGLVQSGVFKLLEESKKIDPRELGFYIGYIAINILELFVPWTKLGRIAKVNFPKAIEGLLNGFRKTVAAGKKVSKKAAELLFDSLDLLITFLKKGTDEFVNLVKTLFIRFRKWLDELSGGKTKLRDAGDYSSSKAKVAKKVDDVAPLAVKNYEKSIATKDLEHGYIYNENKKLSIEHQGTKYEDTIIWYSRIGRAEFGGSVVTHNHPTSSGLSLTDIEMFLRYNVKEIRAVGRDGSVFSMVNNNMGYGNRKEMLDIIKERKLAEGATKDKIEREGKVFDALWEELKNHVDYNHFKNN